MRLILTFAFALVSNIVLSQTLTLDEIINLRSLDTVELRKFSLEKGFKLRLKKEDRWIHSHSYYSPTDKSVWYIRTFPKDTTANKYVYYYHTYRKAQREFENQIISRGFKFKETYEKSYGDNKYTHNYYEDSEYKIDLASEYIPGRGTKYIILFSKKVDLKSAFSNEQDSLE